MVPRDLLCTKDILMEHRMYCFPTYDAAKEAFYSILEILRNAETELGVTITVYPNSLEIHFVSVLSGEDILFKFIYIPVRILVDLERIKGYRGEINLYPILREIEKQVDAVKQEMWAFAAIVEGTYGNQKKGGDKRTDKGQIL